VPAEQEKPDSIPSEQQFYQLAREISVKQRFGHWWYHHKYLYVDKNPHQKQSMM
jgi:hypothetical protein